MAIFAPQNVMGPAHRGGVIQQLAQTAAHNVMQRQKMKALIQHAAGQAGGRSVGSGQPFRGSTMGHATGVRGATFRPPGLQGGASLMQQSGPGGDGGGLGQQFNYPDPGPADLSSLPDPTDPSQSPASTDPGQVSDPTQPPVGSASAAPSVNGQTYIGGGMIAGQITPGNDVVPVQRADQAGYIPIGNGLFYDPTLDQVTGPTRPGFQLGR